MAEVSHTSHCFKLVNSVKLPRQRYLVYDLVALEQCAGRGKADLVPFPVKVLRFNQ